MVMTAQRLPARRSPNRDRAVEAAAQEMQHAWRQQIHAHQIVHPNDDLTFAEQLASVTEFWVELADIAVRAAAPLIGGGR